MITGTIDEVFIKEVTDAGIDMVSIVRNLPKKLIYDEVPATVTRYDRDGYTDGTQMVDPSGKKKEALKEGLEYSQTDDGSILFRVSYEPGKIALATIDQYIAGTLPRDVMIPSRVPYPMQKGDTRSMPKPKNLIPAIDLPKPDIRTEETVSPVANAASVKPVRTLSPEQKVKRAEILKKAREAKAAKKELK